MQFIDRLWDAYQNIVSNFLMNPLFHLNNQFPLQPYIFGFFISGFREGNGTPLQYSCLKNPMDGGAWQAAVHGVANSWTRLSNFPFTFIYWRRKWQPTQVLLPGESQGRGSLVGFHLWGRIELDATETTQQQQLSQGYCFMMWALINKKSHEVIINFLIFGKTNTIMESLKIK